MKKKFSVPAKDKKDWINFTKESGNIISKDDDSLEGKEMGDEEMIHELIKLRGVGKWTAEMILIFTMLRPDVFPIGDIGMIRGIEKSYNSGEKMSREELYAISEKWKPWRTVACCFMWRTVDPEPVEY